MIGMNRQTNMGGKKNQWEKLEKFEKAIKNYVTCGTKAGFCRPKGKNHQV